MIVFDKLWKTMKELIKQRVICLNYPLLYFQKILPRNARQNDDSGKRLNNII